MTSHGIQVATSSCLVRSCSNNGCLPVLRCNETGLHSCSYTGTTKPFLALRWQEDLHLIRDCIGSGKGGMPTQTIFCSRFQCHALVEGRILSADWKDLIWGENTILLGLDNHTHEYPSYHRNVRKNVPCESSNKNPTRKRTPNVHLPFITCLFYPLQEQYRSQHVLGTESSLKLFYQNNMGYIICKK